MNKIQIPASYRLMGEKIEVEEKADLIERRGHMGEFHEGFNEIKLDPRFPREVEEVSFFHELTHSILAKMGRTDLNEDEAFVTVFGGLLHQAIQTMEMRK